MQVADTNGTDSAVKVAVVCDAVVSLSDPLSQWIGATASMPVWNRKGGAPILWAIVHMRCLCADWPMGPSMGHLSAARWHLHREMVGRNVSSSAPTLCEPVSVPAVVCRNVVYPWLSDVQLVQRDGVSTSALAGGTMLLLVDGSTLCFLAQGGNDGNAFPPNTRILFGKVPVPIRVGLYLRLQC